MSARGFQAVTFDAGGTLIEPWPSVGHVYAEVAKEFGIECDPAAVTRRFGEAWRARQHFGYSREEWGELVRRSFDGEGEISPEIFSAIYKRFAQPGAWIIYDDVIPALAGLEAKGIALAVISNWDERLIETLTGLGLASYFDAIIVSSSIGAHKPERRIFDAAAEALNIPPAGILHVGDSELEDVQGALAAGFQARRIRRSGTEKDCDIEKLTRLLGPAA